jgi:hypothetical protein
MTELEAANKALAALGAAPIGSFGDDTEAARTAGRLMEPARLAVLSEFAWPFALRLRPLVPSDQTVPPGWLYAFAYPEGAAALYQVYTGNMLKIHYIVQDGAIFTSRPECAAEYTSIDVPLADWPHLAAEAFAARLASDAAVTLTGNPGMASAMLEKYGLLLQFAKANSLNEEFIPRANNTDYIDVRH